MGILDFAWILVFGLLGALTLLSSIRYFGHWFTPLSLLVGINCASMCAYHLRLLEMKDVSILTHVIVLSCLASYWVGCLLARGNDQLPPPDAVRDGIDRRGLDGFFKITAGIATVGWLLAAIILVSRYGGIGRIFASLWRLQDEFQMQGLGYLNMLGILVLPAYVLKRALGIHRRLDLLLVGSAIWGLLMAGIKGFVFYSVLTAIVTWSVARPDRFRVRTLLLTAGILLAFFVAYSAKVDIFMADIVTADKNWFTDLRPLHWPYVYFVGAWPAMDNMVKGAVADPAITGAVTLNAVWKIVGDLLGIVDPVPFNLPFSDIGIQLFNVYSMFGILYQEWTIPGAVVICGLLGFIGTRLYRRARRAGYWGHLLVYGLFAYGLFMSCFMYVYRFNEMVLLLYVYCVAFVALRGGVLVDRREAP